MARFTAAALLCLCATLSVSRTQGKTATTWVDEARATDGSFDLTKRTTLTVSADCSVTTSIAGNTAAPITGPIVFASGASAVLDICAASDVLTSTYMTATDLFAGSAFVKAVSQEGYIKADVFEACEVVAGHCCQVHFVPVVPGFYQVTNSKCLNGALPQTLASVHITGTAADTLEQDTLKQYVEPANRSADVAGAVDSSWAGWADVVDIEISLVALPACNLPVPARRLLADSDISEGDGETADLGALDLMWVYSKGHTGTTTSLVTVAATPVADQIEGGEGTTGRRLAAATLPDVSDDVVFGGRTLANLTPAANEGADGVLEGQGEGTATPAADEGADGVLEGQGEGTATPAADEGADGVLEGQGEGTAAPAADEGADGVLEGQGEGAATPAANEGADGVLEGQGEGAATPAADEGADGVLEGQGEGAATPAANEGADGVLEGQGEGTTIETVSAEATVTVAEAAPAADEGADGILEGQGEGSAPSVVGEFVNARDYPIEMIVNKPYRLTFNVVRSSGHDFYFTAPEFFADAVVRKVETTFAEFKFATYPTEMELSGDGGSFEMYVVPTVKGDYNIRSGNLDQKVLPYGRMRVIGGTPTDGAKFKKVTIGSGDCAPGSPGSAGSGASTASIGFSALAVLVTIFLAL